MISIIKLYCGSIEIHIHQKRLEAVLSVLIQEFTQIII